ncbi:MAG: acetyltransferase [Chitinophagaceae bacterium]
MNLILIGANNPETLRMISAINKPEKKINVIGFLDNDESKVDSNFWGYTVLGKTSNIKTDYLKNCFFVNLITGNMAARFEVSKEIAKQGGKFANFIHPSVNLEMVELGVGNYIQESVVVQACVTIGNNSSIHIGSMVGHECKIGNSSFIAHGCNLSGFTNIEDGVFLGAGVSTVPRVTIGKWSIIGTGAVVTKDIPPFSVAVGNPAKVIKQINTSYSTTSGDIF